jgi:hypothetical protein
MYEYKSVEELISKNCITVYTLQKSYKSPRNDIGRVPHFFAVVFSRSARTDRLHLMPIEKKAYERNKEGGHTRCSNWREKGRIEPNKTTT